MNVVNRTLILVQQALNELDSPNYRLSDVIPKVIHIARLRNDFECLQWLKEETISVRDDRVELQYSDEIKSHCSLDKFELTRQHLVEDYINARKMNDLEKSDPAIKVCRWSVLEIEEHIGMLESEAKMKVPPRELLDPNNLRLIEETRSKNPFIPGPSKTNPLDPFTIEKLYRTERDKLRANARVYRTILSRIRQRVYDFLSMTEQQLLYGKVNSDIFEKSRRYVDSKLSIIAPEVLEQFVAVYRRLSEGDSEARSHALLSCRRILNSVADTLYPARSETVVEPSGKERKLTKEKYISRLWQFVTEKVGGRAAGELLLVQVKEIGSRIDCIYNLACKGTHADVSEHEANQCVIQTYLLVSDLLHLADQDSKISAKVEEVVDA